MSESIVIEEPIPSIVVLEEPPKLITIIEEKQKDVIVVSGNVIDTTLLSKESKQDIGNSSLASIDSKLTSPIQTNGLTDSQLRAAPVPVSGTLSIDTSALAKESKQDTANNSLSSIDSKLTSPLSANVLNFPATQPVSATSLPLPTGASTSANQATEIASLSSIDSKLTDNATSTLQETANNSLSSIDTKLTNNATSTLQSAGNASLSNLDSNLGARNDSLASSDTGTFSLIALFKRLLDKLTNIISVRITDGAGTVNTKSLGTALLSGDISIIVSSVIHGLTTGGGGGYVDVKVTPSGSLTTESNIVTSVLPTGAATSALQTSGNLSLSNIDGKVPTNGQKASANSLPVVIASEQSQDVMIIGQAAQSSLGNNILLFTAGTGSIDTTINTNSSYRSFHCQIIASAGISAGQIIFEGSNNDVTFHTIPWYDDAVVTGAVISTAIAIAANTNRFFSGKIGYRYIRCRISAGFTGGTVQAITRFSSSDYIQRVLNVTQTTGGSFATTLSSSLPSGTSAIGDMGLQYRANATGAASRSHLVSAANTNPTVIKASAGRLLGWTLANTTASFIYLKLHNQSGAPVAGTNVFMTLAIPPNSVIQQNLPGGIAFSTGIGITTVTGAADADNTAVGLQAIVGELFFA